MGERTPYLQRLTSEEQRTFTSLADRGHSLNDAFEAALDGVHVDDIRDPPKET